MPTPQTLSAARARAVALAAQGLLAPRPGKVTARHLQSLIDRVGVLQIDSVNVVSRSHYLPVFSRLGGYPTALLDAASATAPRRLVEYWAHEASLIEPATWPLLEFRRARARDEAWRWMREVADREALLKEITGLLADQGPMTGAQVEAALALEEVRDRSHWGWNWSTAKKGLEFLFWTGEVSSAGRNASFARAYDLTERVLPPQIAALPAPDPEAAAIELVRLAARAYGVATLSDLADYFRMKKPATAAAVQALVDAGELAPVTVQGWNAPAWLHTQARIPRTATVSALVSPFDSMVWFRERVQRLFDARLRIEIYVPAPKREFGYYVLPFLWGDRMRARVDLKADRASGRLLVQAAWQEPGHDHEAEMVQALASELRQMATWLGLDDVVVMPRGDLAAPLSLALL